MALDPARNDVQPGGAPLWDLNEAVVFGPVNNGYDGPSAYADPFETGTKDSTYQTLYMTGNNLVGSNILRSDDGGTTWVVGAQTNGRWHPRMTTTFASDVQIL